MRLIKLLKVWILWIGIGDAFLTSDECTLVEGTGALADPVGGSSPAVFRRSLRFGPTQVFKDCSRLTSDPHLAYSARRND